MERLLGLVSRHRADGVTVALFPGSIGKITDGKLLNKRPTRSAFVGGHAADCPFPGRLSIHSIKPRFAPHC
jgi:hypothetical protein